MPLPAGVTSVNGERARGGGDPERRGGGDGGDRAAHARQPTPPRHSPEHLDDEPLRPPAVELAVEDGLPRAEVEPPFGDRQHDLVVDEQVLEVRVAVVLAAAVVAVVAGVGGELRATSFAGSFHEGGASLSSHSSASSRMPGSSSLTHTAAVMCMAETSTMPSSTPDSTTAAWTSSVMRTNWRRCCVVNVR